MKTSLLLIVVLFLLVVGCSSVPTVGVQMQGDSMDSIYIEDALGVTASQTVLEVSESKFNALKVDFAKVSTHCGYDVTFAIYNKHPDLLLALLKNDQGKEDLYIIPLSDCSENFGMLSYALFNNNAKHESLLFHKLEYQEQGPFNKSSLKGVRTDQILINGALFVHVLNGQVEFQIQDTPRGIVNDNGLRQHLKNGLLAYASQKSLFESYQQDFEADLMLSPIRVERDYDKVPTEEVDDIVSLRAALGIGGTFHRVKSSTKVTQKNGPRDQPKGETTPGDQNGDPGKGSNPTTPNPPTNPNPPGGVTPGGQGGDAGKP